MWSLPQLFTQVAGPSPRVPAPAEHITSCGYSVLKVYPGK